MYPVAAEPMDEADGPSGTLADRRTSRIPARRVRQAHHCYTSLDIRLPARSGVDRKERTRSIAIDLRPVLSTYRVTGILSYPNSGRGSSLEKTKTWREKTPTNTSHHAPIPPGASGWAPSGGRACAPPKGPGAAVPGGDRCRVALLTADSLLPRCAATSRGFDRRQDPGLYGTKWQADSYAWPCRPMPAEAELRPFSILIPASTATPRGSRTRKNAGAVNPCQSMADDLGTFWPTSRAFGERERKPGKNSVEETKMSEYDVPGLKGIHGARSFEEWRCGGRCVQSASGLVSTKRPRTGSEGMEGSVLGSKILRRMGLVPECLTKQHPMECPEQRRASSFALWKRCHGLVGPG
jgi:hypothetical protein